MDDTGGPTSSRTRRRGTSRGSATTASTTTVCRVRPATRRPPGTGTTTLSPGGPLDAPVSVSDLVRSGAMARLR